MKITASLLGVMLLGGCISSPISVTARAAGCAALLPPEWNEGVAAPEFDGQGNVVADWIAYADAVAGRLDQANDRTRSTIGIVQRCEQRDAAAIQQATRRKFLGIF